MRIFAWAETASLFDIDLGSLKPGFPFHLQWEQKCTENRPISLPEVMLSCWTQIHWTGEKEKNLYGTTQKHYVRVYIYKYI